MTVGARQTKAKWGGTCGAERGRACVAPRARGATHARPRSAPQVPPHLAFVWRAPTVML
eukprot:CAMPEP_0179946658 /NCGR_PEP_ID=MMETSP0983-20121128/20499_1 /TAXON_ID=483367 /ORGANISM="non described non described, Strain CCMP 2436" /LENGTH=58 /DNA_ID=CAMNT_0021855505 /DNA_START=126 /DNA_END=298 /DNA_ORIENTATION=-